MNAFLDALAPGIILDREEGKAVLTWPGHYGARTLRWREIGESTPDSVPRLFPGVPENDFEIEVAEESAWSGEDGGGLLAALRAWMVVNGLFVEKAPVSGIDLTWGEPLPERVIDVVGEVMAERGLVRIHWEAEMDAGWAVYGKPGGTFEWYAWFSFCRSAVDPLTGADIPGLGVWQFHLHRPGIPFSIPEENTTLLEVLGRCLPVGVTPQDLRFVEEEE